MFMSHHLVNIVEEHFICFVIGQITQTALAYSTLWQRIKQQSFMHFTSTSVRWTRVRWNEKNAEEIVEIKQSEKNGSI